LPFNIKKIQDRFDKYWSYTEIKKLVDFIAEADLKIKRGTLSKEIIDELLKFI
jgi:DNA polymerase III delta subunit